MFAVILGLHAIGFVILVALVAPEHYRLGASGASASESASPRTRSG